MELFENYEFYNAHLRLTFNKCCSQKYDYFIQKNNISAIHYDNTIKWRECIKGCLCCILGTNFPFLCICTYYYCHKANICCNDTITIIAGNHEYTSAHRMYNLDKIKFLNWLSFVPPSRNVMQLNQHPNVQNSNIQHPNVQQSHSNMYVPVIESNVFDSSAQQQTNNEDIKLNILTNPNQYNKI